jgi:hypothetical protein
LVVHRQKIIKKEILIKNNIDTEEENYTLFVKSISEATFFSNDLQNSRKSIGGLS